MSSAGLSARTLTAGGIRAVEREEGVFQMTIVLWDRLGLAEPGVSLSEDGRRRLVAPRWEGAPAFLP